MHMRQVHVLLFTYHVGSVVNIHLSTACHVFGRYTLLIGRRLTASLCLLLIAVSLLCVSIATSHLPFVSARTCIRLLTSLCPQTCTCIDSSNTTLVTGDVP